MKNCSAIILNLSFTYVLIENPQRVVPYFILINCEIARNILTTSYNYEPNCFDTRTFDQESCFRAIMFSHSFLYLSFFLSLLFHSLALSNLPLSTLGRNIIDNAGETVTYVGVNWPGHMDAMIPEGLQYQSIENIVSRIKSVGFNVIRLTFAVEMVDNIIYGGDTPVKVSLSKALGDKDGQKVWDEIKKRNPGLASDITRLKVVQRFHFYK
jgi:hypothetical protein